MLTLSFESRNIKSLKILVLLTLRRPSMRRSQECERGTQECVRHMSTFEENTCAGDASLGFCEFGDVDGADLKPRIA